MIEQHGSQNGHPQNVGLADHSAISINNSTPRRTLTKPDQGRKKLHVRFESVTNDLFGDLDTPLPDVKSTLRPSNSKEEISSVSECNGNLSDFPRTDVMIPKDTKTTSYVIQGYSVGICLLCVGL